MLRIELDNGKTVWTDSTMEEFANSMNDIAHGAKFYITKEDYVIAISHIVWVKEE